LKLNVISSIKRNPSGTRIREKIAEWEAKEQRKAIEREAKEIYCYRYRLHVEEEPPDGILQNLVFSALS